MPPAVCRGLSQVSSVTPSMQRKRWQDWGLPTPGTTGRPHDHREPNLNFTHSPSCPFFTSQINGHTSSGLHIGQAGKSTLLTWSEESGSHESAELRGSGSHRDPSSPATAQPLPLAAPAEGTAQQGLEPNSSGRQGNTPPSRLRVCPFSSQRTLMYMNDALVLTQIHDLVSNKS